MKIPKESTDIGRPIDPIPTVEFKASGLGHMRSTGEFILLLLSIEDASHRTAILCDVAKSMGISLQDFSDEYLDEGCARCGISLLAHRRRGGDCF